MEENGYKKIVKNRYFEEAKKTELSLSSTMPDLNTRRLEIENIVKYLDENSHCLEIGCGNGAASIEISKNKKLDLISTDDNEKMIELAKRQPRDNIKGNLEFKQTNVLDLNYDNIFDTVFSIRCIINLMTWDDQKIALKKMINAVKNNGKIILLEAFSDGLGELNQARNEFNLEPIPPAFHNFHLKKDLVINYLSENNCKLIEENNFLSSYYFASRVLYPILAKANNIEMIKNSKFDQFFSFLPSFGNFAHIKILHFEKINS